MLQDPVLLFCNGGPCKVNCFPHGITGPEMGVNLEDARHFRFNLHPLPQEVYSLRKAIWVCYFEAVNLL